MRIVNRTKWDTDDLRRFVAAVAARELDAFQRRGFVLEIRNDTQVHGLAWIGAVRTKSIAQANAARPRWHARIWLPNPGTGAVPFSVRDVARTLAHEFALARGQGHPEMRGGPYDCHDAVNLERYVYIDEFPVHAARPAPVNLESARAERLTVARARIEELDRQIARLMRLRAKWQRRAGARERSLKQAAMKGTPE